MIALIEGVEGWFLNAPPKKGTVQWKDGRSAKELARAWFRPSMPEELCRLPDSCPEFQGFHAEEAIPEYQIRLDDFGGEPRNADLLVMGCCADGPGLLTIEAKADEEFGPLVGAYYNEKSGSRSKVPERIRLLIQAMFGCDLNESPGLLRYQLLHGAAATLIEAKNRKAKLAAFIVHEFLSEKTQPEKVQKNGQDLRYFISLLGTEVHGGLTGPCMVPGNQFVPNDIPLFLGKASTNREAQ
jgi:hypothetical protein